MQGCGHDQGSGRQQKLPKASGRGWRGAVAAIWSSMSRPSDGGKITCRRLIVR
jgi:hypothetical protein